VPRGPEFRLINANKSVYIAAPKFSVMEYNRIVAVTGISGLFEVLSSKSDGALVRSLEDKSTKFISSRVHNLSHLESIEVYTVRDNVQLTDIFTAMKSSNEALPDVKDNNALKGYFEKVYPDLDFERVYTSDMKKMVKWYEVIQANDIDFTVKEEAEEEGTEEEAVTASADTEAPPKKAAAPKKAKAEKPDEEEEKPAPKKKAAATEEKPAAKAKAAPEKAPAKAKAPAKSKTAEKEAPAKKAAAPKKKSK
jgi:hypothetical protein